MKNQMQAPMWRTAATAEVSRNIRFEAEYSSDELDPSILILETSTVAGKRSFGSLDQQQKSLDAPAANANLQLEVSCDGVG